MQWIQVEPAIHGQREIHLNYKPKAVSSGSVASMNLQESVVSAFCSTAWRELVLRAQKFCQTLPLKQHKCNYFKLCPSSSLIQTSRQLPNYYLLVWDNLPFFCFPLLFVIFIYLYSRCILAVSSSLSSSFTLTAHNWFPRWLLQLSAVCHGRCLLNTI